MKTVFKGVEEHQAIIDADTFKKVKKIMEGSIRCMGYNKDGSVNECEASVVKNIFEKYVSYAKHPPQELVNSVLAENTNLTYEEAEKMVKHDEICRYIIDEINRAD